MPAVPERPAIIALFSAIALIKTAFLIGIGPVFMPDSTDYIAYADSILKSRDWMHHLELGKDLYPLTGFRMIGYPAFLALFKIVFSDAWAWFVVITQMTVSLAVTWVFFIFAREITNQPALAGFAALGHATAQSFYLDQCLLTDSLNASLLITAAIIPARGILRRQPPSFAKAAVIGLLLLLAFLLREAGAILQYALWPLIIFWCFAARASLRRTVVIVVLSALPLFLGAQAYKAWNTARTGERFITTGAQNAIYRPALDLYRQGIPVFREDPLLGDAPALDGPPYAIPGHAFSEINQHLALHHGMTPLEIMAYGYAMYVRHWLRYPTARIKIMVGKFDRSVVYSLFMPVVALERVSLWSGGETPLPTSKNLRHEIFDKGRIDLAAALALRTLARILSAVTMAAFFIGVPVLIGRALASAAGRMRDLPPQLIAMGGLWLFAIGYFSAYGAVHMEERYLLPTTPFVFVCGLAVIASSVRPLTAVWATMSKKGGTRNT
ncbi:MAG: hypothetical protein RIB80_08625 [Rhodospirillales bacterium]